MADMVRTTERPTWHVAIICIHAQFTRILELDDAQPTCTNGTKCKCKPIRGTVLIPTTYTDARPHWLYHQPHRSKPFTIGASAIRRAFQSITNLAPMVVLLVEAQVILQLLTGHQARNSLVSTLFAHLGKPANTDLLFGIPTRTKTKGFVNSCEAFFNS